MLLPSSKNSQFRNNSSLNNVKIALYAIAVPVRNVNKSGVRTLLATGGHVTFLPYVNCFIREQVIALDFRSCWIVFIHVVWWRPGVSSSSPRLKLSRSSWYLLRLAFVQCGQTGRNAVLGQQPKGVVARLSVSSHRSICGSQTSLIDSINQEYISLSNCPALTAL